MYIDKNFTDPLHFTYLHNKITSHESCQLTPVPVVLFIVMKMLAISIQFTVTCLNQKGTVNELPPIKFSARRGMAGLRNCHEQLYVRPIGHGRAQQK
jgi:hypothetical protein